MLFNTSEFIFIFLPLAVGLHFLVARRWGTLAAAAVTAIASLIFYAWWKLPYVVLPILSILINFAIARGIVAAGEVNARRLLTSGVVGNLLVLGYFKYADFALSILQRRHPEAAAVPLALSFTTFVQIAFLVDVWRKRELPDFTRYSMFVSFFPHLIAGPIVRWAELGSQINDPRRYRIDFDNLALGMTIFCLGLGKKVLIADRLAPHVAVVFDAASNGQPITFLAGWGAAFAYSTQLYFDFSGYCDMAVGLGLLFNLRLPINFAAPFRSTSIIELWRRWHISLSRFLRDFVYIPLGGSNCGPVRRTSNLVATMTLGGLWHGANWTFIAWGAFHGVLLAINHFWRTWRGPREETLFRNVVGCFVTFTAFAIGMVMFRAADMPAATNIMTSMAGMGKAAAVSDNFKVGWDIPWIESGYLSEPFVRGWFGVNWSVTGTLLTLLAVAIALLVPDTMELVDYREGEPHSNWRRAIGWLAWRPSAPWLAAVVTVFAFSFVYLWDISEFLYYQF
jgi:D-alanyl-lipoteichoic acid acyltransferase DltB (MBOAT superfamily)